MLGNPATKLRDDPRPTLDARGDGRMSAWHASWKFEQPDNGTVAFHIDKIAATNGLVMSLQNSQVTSDTWAVSGGGYAIVLNNGDVDRPMMWVGKLPYFHQEMAGTRKYPAAPLVENEKYWVSVDHGTITVGQGQSVLMQAVDPSPVMNIKYFGFGLFNQVTGQPVDSSPVVLNKIQKH